MKTTHFILRSIKFPIIFFNLSLQVCFSENPGISPLNTESENSSSLFPSQNSDSLYVIFEESFESGSTAWTIGGCWQAGHPSSGPENGYNSSNCAGTNLAGLYPNNTNDWLISPTFQLPGSALQITLSFNEWFELESNYDFGYVNLSTDNGSSWISLDSRSNSSNWKLTTLDLTSFKGSSIVIGFNLVTDGTIMKDGWYIDDIKIETVPLAPLSLSVKSLNVYAFPLVYMNVEVNTFENNLHNLTRSHFKVFENNTLQDSLFEIVPPLHNDNRRLVDLILIIDNSGNTESFHAQLGNSLPGFFDQFLEDGVDLGIGLCRFGQSNNNGNPVQEDNGIITRDLDYFMNNVWLRNVSNGSREPGFYAITQSISGFCFRPGAQKIFVILTNENPDQGGANLSQTINMCQNNNVTLFALTSPESSALNQVAEETQGACSSLYDPLPEFLNTIGTSVSHSYIICYHSENPDCNGVQRHLDIQVSYDGFTASENRDYTPCKYPKINTTPEAEALHLQAWPENSTLVIQAKIQDLFYPPVNQVKLFYKNAASGTYQNQWMIFKGNEIWEGIIPPDVVQFPGVDYFITAGDGFVKVSLPAAEAAVLPFQLAVLPNQVLIIHHEPLQNYPMGNPINVTASVIANPGAVEYGKLYFRNPGHLLFQSETMEPVSDNVFSMTIPYSYTIANGLEYYLSVWDIHGIRTDHGSPDHPHFAHGKTGGLNHCMQPGWQLISSFVEPENSDIELIMEKLSKDNAFTIMLNRQGVYWPANHYNTLGTWNSHSAYKINITRSSCLEMQGPMPVNKTVNLLQGVNYLPVLDDDPVSAANIFSQVAGKLTYALELKDNLVYWPSAGLYTLQALEPGKGYLVLMQSPGQVTFPETTLKNDPPVNIIQPAEEAPWEVNHTGIVHLVALNETALQQLMPGDYLYGFAGNGKVAGFTRYRGAPGNLALTLYGDDPSTAGIDGFNPGEEINLGVYRPAFGDHLQITPQWSPEMPDHSAFVENGASGIHDFRLEAIPFENPSENPVTVFPNPSSGMVTITGIEEPATITVYDIIYKQALTTGSNGSVELNLSDLPKGIYIIRVVSGNYSCSQKVALQ